MLEHRRINMQNLEIVDKGSKVNMMDYDRIPEDQPRERLAEVVR